MGFPTQTKGEQNKYFSALSFTSSGIIDSMRDNFGYHVVTKALDFHLEQVQDFTPTPMTISTEAWYTGYDPYTLELVYSAKTPREKLAQRQFFFWYKPEERRNIARELRRIGKLRQ